jgi:hypothetical protein
MKCTLEHCQNTAGVGKQHFEVHVGWRLYLLRNVPATWCYRAINYAIAPVGSDAQIFLAAEAAKGNCTELLDGKDEYVEFGFDEASQQMYWSSADVKNSSGFPNKYGCKINFCLCVGEAPLSAFFMQTHDVPHFQNFENDWLPTSKILTIEKERIAAVQAGAAMACHTVPNTIMRPEIPLRNVGKGKADEASSCQNSGGKDALATSCSINSSKLSGGSSWGGNATTSSKRPRVLQGTALLTKGQVSVSSFFHPSKKNKTDGSVFGPATGVDSVFVDEEGHLGDKRMLLVYDGDKSTAADRGGKGKDILDPAQEQPSPRTRAPWS